MEGRNGARALRSECILRGIRRYHHIADPCPRRGPTLGLAGLSRRTVISASCLIPQVSFCSTHIGLVPASYTLLANMSARPRMSVTDILHRGLLYTLVGITVWGVVMIGVVHRDTLKRGRGVWLSSVS